MLYVHVCLFTCPHGLFSLQTKSISERADRRYKVATWREEGQLGVHEEHELVVKHAEDTLDKKGEPTNKELNDMEHLLNLEE